MPSRYGPGVLPQAFDFGSIIDRLAQGYAVGRGFRRERREEREREEAGERERAARRSYDLSQPGAATLSDYLDTELAAGRQPLTERTLSRVGRADEQDVDLEFTPPEPTTVTLPSGQTTRFQERAPFETETGVVIDPRRAREERTLATYMDAQMLREPIRKPWEREGFASEEEYLKYLAGESRAKYTGRPRPGATSRPLAYNQALDAVDQLYPRVWDETSARFVGELSEPERDAMARSIMRGEAVPRRPEPPPLVAPPIRATPPRESGESGISRVFRSIGDFFRGRRAPAQAGAPPPAAPPAAAPAAPPAAPPRAPELPQPRPLEDLDLTPEQQAQYQQLLDEGWAPDDAVDELAADEWDALVAGGLDPAEATQQIAQKYGISEGP